VLSNTQADAFVDDFEEPKGLSPGWSWFNDVTPMNSFEIMQVSGGAVGTLHSGSYQGTGAKTAASGGFGVGIVYNTGIDATVGQFCIDVSAFTGVSFWGMAATDSTVQLNFVIPQLNETVTNEAGVRTGGGDCVPTSSASPAPCYNYPHATVSLTTIWSQFTVPFSTAGGGAAPLGNYIQELEWLALTSDWNFTIDEIAFYSGTAPTSPVGPNPNGGSDGEGDASAE
jgi:hypothetical protein